MANGNSILAELSRFVADLHRKRDKAAKQLAEIDEEVKAVETTINLYRTDGALYEPEAYKSIVPELQGKHHIDALVHIASRSDGNIIKVVDAKRLMTEAGLLRNPKSALPMLYTIISRSGRFEKVSPGIYRLMPTQ